MWNEALQELTNLPDSYAEHPDAVQIQAQAMIKLHCFNEALDKASVLCRVSPEKAGGYIHAAFCLHELGRTGDAKALLLSGPESLLKEPTYHYNLGCYEAALGNLEEARQHLKKSFSLDGRFRDYAKTDPDLEPLRDALE